VAEHVPVLLREAIDSLAPDPGGTYLDGTFGGGGHSRGILSRLGPDGRLIALDWDANAAERAAALRGEDGRMSFARSNFADLEGALDALGVGMVDGILLDVGLSSRQLADADRGFSFALDGPMDMRMDSRARRTAADAVNRLPEADLARILFELGEMRQSRKVARRIVERRRRRRFETTRELADAVAAAVPRTGRLHPATRVFQALRIWVNDELGNLRAALDGAARRIRPGGRLAVISFHSLEDRIVKDFIRGEGQDSPFSKLGPLVRPAREEVASNPRARSARLRAGVRKDRRHE